jgi:hypothetical protein
LAVLAQTEILHLADDFSDGVVSPYWQPEHSEDASPPIVVSESDNTLQIVIDKSKAAEAGSETYGFSALVFNFQSDYHLNMMTTCFVSVKVKASAAVPFQLGVADSISGTNTVTITKNVAVADDFVTLYFNFRGLFQGTQDSSGITRAYLNFKPGYGAAGVYQGTVWLKDFRMGTYAELPSSTGLSENFNAPVDLDTWSPNKWTHEDGTPFFTVTQEEDALKVVMKQASFPDGQHYSFGHSYNLDAYPFVTIQLKLEAGAKWGDTEVETVPFSMSPWDTATTYRQHSNITFDVPADDQWSEYVFDWTEEDVDQATYPNDYSNICRFLLETVRWPDPHEATFWIDNFSFGTVAPNAIEPELENGLPAAYALSQNFPNPFNPVTNIYYTLPQAGDVLVEIYNITGQRVSVLVDRAQAAGQYHITYDARDLASGVYIIHLKSGRFNAYKRMTLVK